MSTVSDKISVIDIVYLRGTMRNVLFIVILLLTSCPVWAKQKMNSLEGRILERTNFERESVGLGTLIHDTGLAELARKHSKNMLAQGFFAHEDPDGKRVGERANDQYPELLYYSIAENLASVMHHKNTELMVDAAMQGWLNSPGHRDNLLNSRYTHLGVGAATDGKIVLITQVFAFPLVKLGTRIPPVVDSNKELVLYLEYMRNSEPGKFEAYLHYPNPRKAFFVDETTYVLGFEPFKPEWINSKIFRIRLRFDDGRGTYRLTFGDGGSFLGNYYIIEVQ